MPLDATGLGGIRINDGNVRNVRGRNLCSVATGDTEEMQ